MKETILEKLFVLKDEKYKLFSAKLIPNEDLNNLIGVQVPKLRKLAKQLYGTNIAKIFLMALPHKYHEENLLHALLIELEKNYETALNLTNSFLPYITNWAVCDLFYPNVFKLEKDKFLEQLLVYSKSSLEYTVRFAIVAFMRYLDDKDQAEKLLNIVKNIEYDSYYVDMAKAWFFCEALIKQYDLALPYIKNSMLQQKIHNKVIQKAVDSYRIDISKKEYLKSLRVKVQPASKK